VPLRQEVRYSDNSLEVTSLESTGIERPAPCMLPYAIF
jgi:hypothetical protein